MKNRVLYLDVDDTILVWANDCAGYAAPQAAEFVKWAMEYFEVRWLTAWSPSGKMHRTDVLSRKFNYEVTEEEFHSIVNPRPWIDDKTDGVDFNDPRPWVWVEDELPENEIIELKRRKCFDNYYYCNVSKDKLALQKVWKQLCERFALPGGPPEPFDHKLDFPIEIHD